MIFSVIGMVIGVLIFGGGIYYLLQERGDKESFKIYSITAGIGAVIAIIMVVIMILQMVY